MGGVTGYIQPHSELVVPFRTWQLSSRRLAQCRAQHAVRRPFPACKSNPQWQKSGVVPNPLK